MEHGKALGGGRPFGALLRQQVLLVFPDCIMRMSAGPKLCDGVNALRAFAGRLLVVALRSSSMAVAFRVHSAAVLRAVPPIGKGAALSGAVRITKSN